MTRRKPGITAAIRRTGIAAGLAALALTGPGCELLNRFTAPPRTPALRVTEPTPEQEERLDEARAARDAGDYEQALEIFQEILAENPTITSAYIGIGDIYMLVEDYASAEPAYARAARIEPRNFDAQYGHGLALQMLKRFGEAVRAYHRALTIDPDNAKANLNIALTYFQMKEPRRAVTFAERAVELDPENGPARANLGAIYEELGRNSEAIDTYLVALELMGNQPPLMLNLITVLGKESRFREAANTARALVRLEPSANAYERLGWCAFKLREYDASIEAYRSAVEIEPEHWPSLNGIGVNALNAWLLSKKRDADARAEAREAFRRSLRVNPGQQKVVALLLNYSL